VSKKPKNGREVARENAVGGAPTKYKPEYCKLLVEHMESGLSFLSFAGTIGVCFDTLYEWERVFPEFSEAKRQGKARLLLWDEKLLAKGTEGKQRGYNINAHKWKMANTHGWKEKTEITERKPGDKTDEELIADTEKLLNEVRAVK
jgi:hypothetical protein